MRIENLFHSAVIVVFLATLPTARGAQDGPKTIVVRAGRIHTLTGDAIDDGAVVIRDGKIVSVGPLADAPPDAEIIELRDSVITPGLIDAHAAIDQEIRQAPGGAPRRRSFWQDLADAAVRQHDHAAGEEQEDPVCAICAADPSRAPQVCPQKALHELTMTTGCPVCNYPNNLTAAVGVGAGESWAEHSSEVTPHLNVIDSVNFLSTDFDRLLRGGVTTVWVSPDSGSVIGMRGAIVKTGGPLGSRIVRGRARHSQPNTASGEPRRRRLHHASAQHADGGALGISQGVLRRDAIFARAADPRGGHAADRSGSQPHENPRRRDSASHSGASAA